MKRALYVDSPDTRLGLEGRALVLRVGDQPPRSLPLNLIDRVVLARDTQLSSRLLAALGDAGIGVLAFGGRGGERVACLQGAPVDDLKARTSQALCLVDPLRQAELARHFLLRRLRAQGVALRAASSQLADPRGLFALAGGDVLRQQQRIRAAEPDIDTLRIVNARSEANWYRPFAAVSPPGLCFRHRRGGPRADPVNACISLCQALLRQAAVRAAQVAGLDPSMGFLHATAPGRPALAWDLAVACQPRLDLWVMGLFASGRFTLADFEDCGGTARLTAQGRRTLYEDWFAQRAPLERQLRRHAHALAGTLRAHAGTAGDHAAHVANGTPVLRLRKHGQGATPSTVPTDIAAGLAAPRQLRLAI